MKLLKTSLPSEKILKLYFLFYKFNFGEPLPKFNIFFHVLLINAPN